MMRYTETEVLLLTSLLTVVAQVSLGIRFSFLKEHKHYNFYGTVNSALYDGVNRTLFLFGLQVLQMKSSSSETCSGFRPKQKRWYQSSQPSH